MHGMMAAAIAIGLTAGAAMAQQIRYLVPGAFDAERGEAVSLGVRDADGAAVAWPGAAMSYFFVRGAGTQENRERLDKPLDGAPSWTMQHDGLQVIGVDLEPRTEAVSGEALAAFVEAHAPGVAAPAAEAELEVRRVESFKTYVRVGAVAGAREPASEKTALQVDLRTLMDPTAMPAGSTLAFRAYVKGGSVPGAHVTATHLESGRTRTDVADGSGIGSVKLPWPGAWRLEFHDVRAPADDEPWTIYSSALTFEVREARP